MNENNLTLKYPKLTWPSSGWWFTVLGALGGITFFLYPPLTDLKLAPRIALAIILLLLPAIFITLKHMGRMMVVFCQRAVRFNALLAGIDSLEERLTSAQFTIGDLIQERQNRNAYRISYCYIYDDRTFIALRRKRGATVETGARITVIDTETGSVMGYFRTTRQTDEDYLCQQDGYMDALWLGNVKQHGSQHSEAPPEALAFVISNTTGDQNE